MIKAVLFDFDETLQDRTLAFDAYIGDFLKHFCPDIDEDEADKRRQDMHDTDNGGYFDRVVWGGQLIDMWGLGSKVKPEDIAEHYITNFGNYDVIMDNTVPLLKALKEKGLIVGIITNGPSYLQNTKLKTSGLLEYLDIAIVSGDIQYRKPQPEIFKYTADKLSLKTEECVYVGDHPINDIQGSLESGMKAIRMNWGWFKNQDLREDVPIITDIIDVLKYV